MADKINNIKHGTTTIAVKCKEGIVLVADKRASLGDFMIGDKDVQKIYLITDNIAVTHAGTMSDAQLLTKLLKAELQLKRIRTKREVTVKEAANLLAGMMYENIRKMSMIPGVVGMLMGGKDPRGFHLYNLGIDGSVMEKKNYSTDGSGMIFAIAILDAEYKSDLNIEQGIQLALKAMNAALKRDFHTGDGVDIYTVTDEGIKKVATKKVPTRIED